MCLQKCCLWQIVDARDMKVFLCNAMLTPGWCTGWRVQDAAKRQKCKMARNGIDEDLWGGQAKAMGEIWILQPLAEAFQYWCQNSEKWALLFYLALKLWTMTQAIIKSVGPSITVSILHGGAVHDCKTVSWHLLLDWYKTFPIYEMFTNIQRELWGSSKFHTQNAWSFIGTAAGLLSYGLEAKQLKIAALD